MSQVLCPEMLSLAFAPEPRTPATCASVARELAALLDAPESSPAAIASAFARSGYRDRVLCWNRRGPELLTRVRPDSEALAALWSAIDHATYEQNAEATRLARADPGLARAVEGLVAPLVPRARGRLQADVAQRLQRSGHDERILWANESLTNVVRAAVEPELVEALCAPSPWRSEVELQLHDWSLFAFYRTAPDGTLHVRACGDIELHAHTVERDGNVVTLLVELELADCAVTLVEGAVDGMGPLHADLV